VCVEKGKRWGGRTYGNINGYTICLQDWMICGSVIVSICKRIVKGEYTR